MESLLEEYEMQLRQVEEAIVAATTNGDEKVAELISLRDNILQLISLVGKESDSECIRTGKSSPLSLESDLDTLLHTKCQAPFAESWSNSVHYHNAMISSVEPNCSLNNIASLTDIIVAVLFLYPTCDKMLPCPYFLEGKCKFTDRECKYSHGHTVAFSALKEYKEPNFELVRKHCVVLAKENKMWKRARILEMTDDGCRVKFECGRGDKFVNLCDVLPLADDENDEKITQVDSSCTVPMGCWEKHTGSIGSKLMSKMGYIAGTGLGKYSDGRIEPVTVVKLPKGKSLDHCMALKEMAGGNYRTDLFEVKVQNQLKRKVAPTTEEKSGGKLEKKDVFHFITNALSDGKVPSFKKFDKDYLKKVTDRELNVHELNISEILNKLNYDLRVLYERLSMKRSDIPLCKVLKKKIDEMEMEALNLKENEQIIKKEKHLRCTKKKMSIF